MKGAHAGPNVTGVTVASVIFPGLGQLILGQVGKGLAMIAVYIVFWYIAWPLALILCVGSAIDAYNCANALNEDLRGDAKTAAEVIESQITAAAFVTQIEKIAKLAASGILDAEELTERKQKIIAELARKTLVGSSEDFLTALIPLMKADAISKDELTQIKSLVPS
jgi:hypothetical protein